MNQGSSTNLAAELLGLYRFHPHRSLHVYCTAARPIVRRRSPKSPEIEWWPEGTTLKIVMLSTGGEIGLTDDLEATCGYQVRIKPTVDDRVVRDIRCTRESTRDQRKS